MFLIVGVLQFGIWHHARQVVQTASQEAARTAAAADGNEIGGRNRALDVLKSGLGSSAKEIETHIELGTESVTARVEVTMRSLLPIPGLSSIAFVSETESYRESFRPEDG